MRRSLRVLIIEDNPADSELILNHLRREGYDVQATRVETKADYLAALGPELDVILSDHTLPEFSAPLALELLQSRGLDVPFIIVSGTIDEEVAVGAMRQGAADYLLKDRLARLGTAVSQAVEQARLRRERRQAVEELRLFRMLVDQSNDTFEVLDPETARFLDVNEKGCNELGYTHAEYCSLRLFDVDPTIEEAAWPQIVANIRSAGTINSEGHHRRKDGTTFPVEVNVKWVNADRDYIVAAVRDITARKQAEDVLRESERRFREMLETVELIAVILDDRARVIFCNDYFLKVTGWSREEAMGADWFSVFAPFKPERRKIFFDTFESGTFPAHYENSIKTKTGDVREIVWNNTMLRGSGGNIVGVARIGTDVTEQKRAEEALRESEKRFRSFMEHSPVAGWIVDAEGRFHYVSPGYYRMFKAKEPDLTGKLISEVIDPALAEEYLANNYTVLHEHRALEAVEPAVRCDGTTGEFMVVKFPMESPDGATWVGGIAMDITERKRLEQQFLRAQRMESIGTLAGGIAHDLNNSLGPIIMSLDVLESKFPDPDSRELLDIIRTSAQHASNMVRQVLSFGRGVEGPRVEVQIRHLVQEIEKIVNDTFPKNIEVRTNAPRDLWTVVGDPTQLHQVLLNLCVNARDAMPGGGILTISAENISFDAHYAGLNLDAHPGDYVLIRVEDSGVGIPPDVIDKIFDPFFTTKGIGKGSGLGLSSSLGIVTSHDGFIRVQSEAGKGAEFQIHLPAQSTAATAADEGAKSETIMPRGNGETILVVDDEPPVREITKKTLEAFGYRVILAADGADAVSIFGSRGGEIDAVLTDISMPIMDGPATIHVLRRMNPQLPIIATSGRATKEQLERIAGLHIDHILAKPSTATELLTEVKRALSKK